MNGLHKGKEREKQEQTDKKRVCLDASCSTLMGYGRCLSASIQQLVPNPLGKTVSPIPSLCLLHLADGRLSALCGLLVHCGHINVNEYH